MRLSSYWAKASALEISNILFNGSYCRMSLSFAACAMVFNALAGGRGVGEFRHILHIASHAHRQIIHNREQRFGAIVVLGREQKRVDFVYAQSQVAACARVITGLQGIARDSLHGFDEFCVVTGFAVRIAVLTDMNNETFMASADCVGEHGLCVDQRD